MVIVTKDECPVLPPSWDEVTVRLQRSLPVVALNAATSRRSLRDSTAFLTVVLARHGYKEFLRSWVILVGSARPGMLPPGSLYYSPKGATGPAAWAAAVPSQAEPPTGTLAR